MYCPRAGNSSYIYKGLQKEEEEEDEEKLKRTRGEKEEGGGEGELAEVTGACKAENVSHPAFYGKSLLTSDLGELLIPDCTLKPLGRTFNTFESLDPRMPEVGSIDVKAPRTHPFLPGY